RCFAEVAALLTLPLVHAGCDPGGPAPVDSAAAGSGAGGTSPASGGSGGSAGSTPGTPGGGTSNGAASGGGAGGTASSGGAPNTAGTAGTAGPSWTPPAFDPMELPTRVDRVEILIDDEARAALEAAPFYGEDVVGSFVDGSGRRYDEVDLNFRGAYALERLIDNDPIGRRNWKVKFRSDEPYRNRREWNFNFEPHLRQKLAYDLMRFAGVRVPSARHVVLAVNAEPQGLYLEYEDPDNDAWLWEMFGDASGDLYKAARDLPASEGQPSQKYFADTTYLGPDDASYPG